ncbi:MAG: hypothetical protein ACLS36_09065 [Streptococcus sp.]
MKDFSKCQALDVYFGSRYGDLPIVLITAQSRYNRPTFLRVVTMKDSLSAKHLIVYGSRYADCLSTSLTA